MEKTVEAAPSGPSPGQGTAETATPLGKPSVPTTNGKRATLVKLKGAAGGFFKDAAGKPIVWKIVIALVFVIGLLSILMMGLGDLITTKVKVDVAQIKESKKIIGKCGDNTNSASDVTCAAGTKNKGKTVSAPKGSATDTVKKKACCDNICTAKNADVTKAREAWANQGCVVKDPTATTVTGLGDKTLAAGWSGKCTIACSKPDGIFVVTGVNKDVKGVKGAKTGGDKTCLAMDAAAWANQGCVVNDPTATTVTGLGTISVDTKYTGKCNITCPKDGQFKVSGPKSKVKCSGNTGKAKSAWGVNIHPSKWSSTYDFVCPSGKVLKTGSDKLTLTRPKKGGGNQFEDQCCKTNTMANCTLEKFYKGIGIPPTTLNWTNAVPAAAAGVQAKGGKPRNWIEDWTALTKGNKWTTGRLYITNEVCETGNLTAHIPCNLATTGGSWTIPASLPPCSAH